MKNRFSLRNKLMIVFGMLILASCLTLGIMAVRTARKAVTEKIQAHLIDKATDTAEIIDGRVNAFFQLLEGVARMPALRDSSVPFSKKMELLEEEAKFNSVLQELYIVDVNGIQHNQDGSLEDYKTAVWFTEAIKGKNYTAEPYIDKTRNDQMFISFS